MIILPGIWKELFNNSVSYEKFDDISKICKVNVKKELYQHFTQFRIYFYIISNYENVKIFDTKIFGVNSQYYKNIINSGDFEYKIIDIDPDIYSKSYDVIDVLGSYSTNLTENIDEPIGQHNKIKGIFSKIDKFDNEWRWQSANKNCKDIWLQYNFANDIKHCITKIVLQGRYSGSDNIKDFIIEISNDNNTWIRLKNIWNVKNLGSLEKIEILLENVYTLQLYKSIKIIIKTSVSNSYFSISSLYLYGFSELDIINDKIDSFKSTIYNKSYNIVPIMSSNENDICKLTRSSFYNSSYEIWKAFNRTNINENDCWHSQANLVPPHWAQIEFKNNKKYIVTSFLLETLGINNNSAKQLPNEIKLYGSNDNITWEQIYITSDAFICEYNNKSNTKIYHISVIASSNKKFIIHESKFKAYSYFKFEFNKISLNGNGIAYPNGSHMNLAKIELNGFTEDEFNQYLNEYKSNFEDLSINKIKLLDINSEIYNKSYDVIWHNKDNLITSTNSINMELIQMFDNKLLTSYNTNSGEYKDIWFQITPNIEKKFYITEMYIKSNDIYKIPQNFILQGSNDEINWEDIKIVYCFNLQNSNIKIDEVKEFLPYKHFRIYVLSSYSGENLSLSKISLSGFEENEFLNNGIIWSEETKLKEEVRELEISEQIKNARSLIENQTSDDTQDFKFSGSSIWSSSYQFYYAFSNYYWCSKSENKHFYQIEIKNESYIVTSFYLKVRESTLNTQNFKFLGSSNGIIWNEIFIVNEDLFLTLGKNFSNEIKININKSKYIPYKYFKFEFEEDLNVNKYTGLNFKLFGFTEQEWNWMIQI